MKTLLVLFGGNSSEYTISLRSSASVLKNLDAAKYNIIKVGITRDGCWRYFDGDISEIENNTWFENAVPAILSPDSSEKALLIMREDGIEKVKIDVIFPVLHGKNGEDGTVQGLFELAGIPYVGCGVLGSSMCMDKAVTNVMADAAGIAQARWRAFTRAEYDEGIINLDEIAEYLKYPIFVKPANAGSSVGISKAHDRAELEKALELAFDNDYKAVLEQTLVGREVECAVMGNDKPVASCVGEILPVAEFYDFDAKYTDNNTGLAIPAELPDGVQDRIRAQAVKVYRTLNCSGLSRCDFFYGDDGVIYFNEVNTLPGFTSISMFPKLFGHEGVAYSDLLDRLVEYALEKHSK